MGKNTKTVFKGFDYMHCDDFARYLSDMAAKGWHFKEWGAGLKFEKGEPEQAVYAVEVFVNASDNDMRPEPNTQEFAEYCEAAGWKFVDAKQKLCIFKRVDARAAALFTPEERVENACKGMFSGTSIVLLLLYALNAGLRWMDICVGIERNIFSGTWFFTFSAWNVMFLGQFFIMMHAMWKRQSLKKKIRDGKEIYIGNQQDGKYHLNFKDIYVILLIMSLMYYFFIMDRIELVILNATIIIVTIGFSLIMNKVRPERDTNVIIQIVFAVLLIISILFSSMMIFTDTGDDHLKDNEKLPLQIADYREMNAPIVGVYYNYEHNLFGSKISGSISTQQDGIFYYIYESEYTYLLDKIWESEFGGKKYNETAVECTSDWGAQKAMRNKIGTYYVQYENYLLVFKENEDVYLTENQIDIIREKLDLR